MINEKIKVPTRIKPGDTIGIVAPAGPFDRQTFSRGIGAIEDMGFDEHNRKDAIINQYQDDLARSQEDGWPYED